MLQNMRRKGPKLYYFRPIEELQPIQMNTISSRLSSLSHTRYHDGGGMFNMIGAGSQQGEGVVGEIESMIIQVKYIISKIINKRLNTLKKYLFFYLFLSFFLNYI